MTNPRRVKQSVEQFKNLKYHELQPSGGKKGPFFWLNILPYFDDNGFNPYDNPIIEKADYLDLLCLLKQACDSVVNRDYLTGDQPVSGEFFRHGVMRYLAVRLHNMESNDFRIKMFLSLPVEALFSYTGSVCKEKQLASDSNITTQEYLTERCRVHYKKCCVNMGVMAENLSILSINEVFTTAFFTINKSWSPLISLARYQNIIINAYELLSDVLWHPFLIAWGERFLYSKTITSLQGTLQK